MYKIIVAGTRGYTDYTELRGVLDYLLKDKLPDVEIVSGTARGADQLGEYYAMEHRLAVKQFHPDWNKGKKAGILRNIQMAEYADALVAFWDGKSLSTGHMIQAAKEHNLAVRIVRVSIP